MGQSIPSSSGHTNTTDEHKGPIEERDNSDDRKANPTPPRPEFDLLGKLTGEIALPPKPQNGSIPIRPNIEEPVVVAEEVQPFRDDFQVQKMVITKKAAASVFMSMISMILRAPELRYGRPPFKYQFDRKSAEFNWRTIQNHGSLENTIRAYPYSTIAYGSEFRSISLLEPIFHRHRYWHRIKRMLSNGSEFPIEDHNDEESQKEDFDLALSYGNHKSAEINHKILLDHTLKELNKGWIIPLLPTDARLLPNATISPMGVVSQSTINDRGEIIPSNRVTHDLSFPGKSSKLSINSRTNMDLLEPCQYGHMLLRVIHYIVALRICYPNLPIVLQKTDFKSAYRRQQLSAKTASQCLSSVKINGEQFVLLNMRLSFGGSACPSEWCLISESITDLANRILEDDSWNPNELPPKLLNKLPPTEILDNSIPFANAKPLLVDIPLEKFGKSDVYIDDVCTVGVLRDGKDELRLKSSVLLAMDVFGRPIHKKEPLPRDPLPSMDKLLSEGGLSEGKCLLGWILDTRRLRIKLHPEKFLHWSSQIKDLVSSGGQT
jgi:hypothetical protein